MTCNICLCGAEAGYPHHEACPYPLYRGTDRQMAEWEKVYANRKAGLWQCDMLYAFPNESEIAPQTPADDFFDVR